MTDKKEMSVNESLAKVNKILRSAGVIRGRSLGKTKSINRFIPWGQR